MRYFISSDNNTIQIRIIICFSLLALLKFKRKKPTTLNIFLKKTFCASVLTNLQGYYIFQTYITFYLNSFKNHFYIFKREKSTIFSLFFIKEKKIYVQIKEEQQISTAPKSKPYFAKLFSITLSHKLFQYRLNLPNFYKHLRFFLRIIKPYLAHANNFALT